MFLTIGDDWNLDDANMIEDHIDSAMDAIMAAEQWEEA